MLAALLNQILLIPAFVGLGLWVQRRLFGSLQTEMAQLLPQSAGHFGLLGIVAAVFAACFLNLFIPLSEPYALLGFLLTGYGALFFYRRSAPGIFSGRDLALLFSFVVVTAFVALCTHWFFDTALYHIPTVTWARLYPLPFGLANLAPFQSYNSSWFVLEGALFFKSGNYATAFSLNAVLVSFFFQATFLALKEAVASSRGRSFSLAFLVACYLLGNYLLWNGSLSPNIPAYLFSLYSWFFLLRFFETKSPLGALLGSGFALFALTAKLFALPSVLMAGVVCLFCWWLHREESKAFLGRYRSPLLFFSLYLGLWLARSLATSGCLLYPQALTCFPSLPWATSLEQVNILGKMIQMTNGGALYGYFTLKQPLLVVLKEASENLTMAFAVKTYLMALVGIGLLVLSKLRRGSSPSPYVWKVLLFGLLAQGVGIVFWTATTSHAARFGMHYLLMAGALVFGLGLFTVERMPKALALLPSLLLSWTFLMGARTAFNTRTGDIQWTDWPDVRYFDTEQRVTASGQVVRVSSHCNDTPPPCTENFAESISFTPRFGGGFIFHRK